MFNAPTSWAPRQFTSAHLCCGWASNRCADECAFSIIILDDESVPLLCIFGTMEYIMVQQGGVVTSKHVTHNNLHTHTRTQSHTQCELWHVCTLYPQQRRQVLVRRILNGRECLFSSLESPHGPRDWQSIPHRHNLPPLHGTRVTKVQSSKFIVRPVRDK